MSLLVEHPQHGIGAIEETRRQNCKVRFASGKTFLVPLSSLEVLSGRTIAGKLPRQDRSFVQHIEKAARIRRGRFALKPKPDTLRGLPGETVTERLVRKFLVGLVTGNRNAQAEAFGVLTSLVSRNIPRGGYAGITQQWGRRLYREYRCECPDYLTAYLLSLILKGDKTVTSRHLINRAKQLNIDTLRASGAVKRGEFDLHVDVNAFDGVTGDGHQSLDVESLDEMARVIRASWLKSLRQPSKSTRVHKTLEDHDGPTFFGK
jgi:hypothetical protein